MEFFIDASSVIGLSDKLRNINDFTTPLERAGVEMLRSIDLNFQDEGRPLPWQALAESTLAQRRKEGAGAKVLQDTGRLKQSWQRGGEGNVWDIGENKIDIGTNVPYALYHEEGTKPYTIEPRDKKALYWAGAAHPVKVVNHPGLVARPMGVIQDEDVETFGLVFVDWLEETL